MCICIFGCWSVSYHLRVTVTLSSDLVFRIIVSSAYFFILLKVGIPNLICGCNFGWLSVTNHFLVTLTFDLFCRNNRVQNISLILFDMGIPNLLYWIYLWILMCRIPLKVTVILIDDLVSRRIVPGAYLLYHFM